MFIPLLCGRLWPKRGAASLECSHWCRQPTCFPSLVPFLGRFALESRHTTGAEGSRLRSDVQDQGSKLPLEHAHPESAKDAACEAVCQSSHRGPPRFGCTLESLLEGSFSVGLLAFWSKLWAPRCGTRLQTPTQAHSAIKPKWIGLRDMQPSSLRTPDPPQHLKSTPKKHQAPERCALPRTGVDQRLPPAARMRLDAQVPTARQAEASECSKSWAWIQHWWRSVFTMGQVPYMKKHSIVQYSIGE